MAWSTRPGSEIQLAGVELCDPAFEGVAFVTLAHDHRVQIGQVRLHFGERVDQDVEALDGDEPAGRDDQR